MLKRERQAFILHQVNLHNKVLCTDLSRLMQVSDDTIRRDLQELADEGKLIKVHGGALSPSFNQGHQASEDIYSYTQKRIIARKAISLIKDGMFVLTGGGTTIIEMARALPKELKATFITGSIPVVFEYMNHPNIEVIVIGDKVSKNSKITAGPEAVSKIRQLRADLCILGINALNIENGVSDNDWEIVQLKRAMIESSNKLICLTIAEKINTQQPLQVCKCQSIDTLITERDPDDSLLQPYAQLGIQIK
jgi:DeoR/GlpR family transcriptional regulator of sugar metabolism